MPDLMHLYADRKHIKSLKLEEAGTKKSLSLCLVTLTFDLLILK